MKRILPGLVCSLLLAGCMGQPRIQDSIKTDILCSCTCRLTLERCEVEEPSCKTREALEERIATLIREGYTYEQITDYFKESEFPSIGQLQRQIKTELESGNPFILYFYNETCSTCITLKPKIEEVEQTFPEVSLFKIEKRYHDALFSEYGVETYPLLIVVVHGVENRKAVTEADDISAFVRDLIESS